VLADPEANKLMHKAGVDVSTSTPEQFEALLQSEMERWGKVVRDTGAVVN
jgi:tripartite-type tricarboxylate transporter receptor subunit TctC